MRYIKELGIVSISCLTVYALYLGHNGVIFSAVIAVIAGISGYEIGVKKKGE
jgi:uncharacterized membrane protein